MRAVFLPGGRRLEVRALEVPEPGPGEVLIGLRAAGLCGSDLHMHYRPAPERRRGPIFGLVTDPDVVPGHEAAGVVAKVGSSVTAFKPGDRVAVHHIGGCGDCVECRRGFDMKCEHKWGIYGLDRPGALEDYMVARSRDCVALPANIDFDEAAYYTCGAGTGYLALRRASFGLGDSVAVVGLGPVGMAAAYFALRAGAVVIGLDTAESRRIFAREIGIPFVLDPAHRDALAHVGAATDGRGAAVVVEASGSSGGRLVALGAAALGGRVVLVGFGDADNVVDLQATVIQKQLDVLGAWMFPLPDLQEMLYDISLRGISIKPLITGTYAIDDAAEAWSAFDQGGPGKTVITWEGDAHRHGR
jgi:threonine dehydrogenase-like Zn-dependent dehydrogenase